ncbi:MAG: hypothetical protein FJY48_13135 [Betaproteobacteria bacterium]|nr:hypothetical protein [Betaproteobacteria bacterium]
MERDQYIQMLRRGMDQNAEVINRPDQDDSRGSVERAVSHIDCMLVDPDLSEFSTEVERAAWADAATRGRAWLEANDAR